MSMTLMLKGLCSVALMTFVVLAPAVRAAGDEDPYEHYIKTSKDFRRVKQDKDFLLGAFASWTYMPWTAHWTIGYNEASGKWSVDHGYNGAFIDRDEIEADGSKTGRLDW